MICPICGQAAGGAKHRQCSKALQLLHAGQRRRSASKTLKASHVAFVTRLSL